jgi:hypothetical protein
MGKVMATRRKEVFLATKVPDRTPMEPCASSKEASSACRRITWT